MVSSPEEAEEIITRWLKEEGAFKEKVESAGFHFNLGAEYRPGRGRLVNIFQSEKSPDRVTIASGMVFGQDMRARLKKMKKARQKVFLDDLRYGLLAMPGNFEFQGEGDEVVGVRLSEDLFYDGLTKTSFFAAMEDNWKKFLFVTWKIQDYF
jgi:hypothetical protein